jgi:hypothetical protein
MGRGQSRRREAQPGTELDERVAEPRVRLARLIPTPASVRTGAAALDAAVVVDVGEVRVSVARGAEPGLVALVLALVGPGARR